MTSFRSGLTRRSKESPLRLSLFLLIGAAGAVGALTRFGLTHAAQRLLGSGFPYGTLLVNVLGCLLIGIFYHAATGLSMDARIVLGSGFLGALTTFSAFGHDTFEGLHHGHYGVAFLNIAANLFLGLVAVAVGYALARQFGGNG